MAQIRASDTNPPAQPPAQQVDEAFQQGIELGREWVRQATVKMAAWAEENPGQMVLAGLAAGFVFGKIFLRPRKRFDLD